MCGITTLTLTFKGDNGQQMSFLHDVLVHDNIEHDFLLGRDFTGSPVKIMETNTHLFLSDQPDVSSIEHSWETNRKNMVDVPIISDQTQTHTVCTNGEVWIPPLSLVGIKCHFHDDIPISIAEKSQKMTFLSKLLI